ncbi:MAG: protein-(glutamine-N5) methyltransferase, release factor-specific [Chloroflexi bacterium RBG_16_50_9]|nr:MAG: protein-(glutamine-N5) methyltransferase, release factor-specific [Chloroflexi bacterium RBG_16_50_9]
MTKLKTDTLDLVKRALKEYSAATISDIDETTVINVAENLLPDILKSNDLDDTGYGSENEAFLYNLISRRIKDLPIAYLTNRCEFLGIELISQSGTFIPKKQTEFLVTTVLDLVQKNFATQQLLNIIDMCTGIGNIAIAVAINLPKAKVYATDISEKAIEIAKKNAAKYHLDQRISFFTGDLFAPLERVNLKGSIDAIICNPPYIPTAKIKNLSKSIIDYEPLNALDGGWCGLHYYMKVISGSVDLLKPGGFLAFEVGGGQGQSVARLMKRKELYSEAVLVSCPGAGEDIVSCSLL